MYAGVPVRSYAGDVGMRVAIHQPDLLPYSGFWFKMATSDAFVIAEHDQFQKHGYQRRVKMRGTWCSHQLDGKPSLVPITSVRVLPGWQERLAGGIRGRYTGARLWKTRGVDFLERLAECHGESLAEVNMSLIHLVRDLLGITTPLLTTYPPTHHGVDRLIEQVLAVGGTAYLSGTGGTAYMGEDAAARFAERGITLEWSDHQMTTGDSILSVMFDTDDVLGVILRRN